MCATHLHHLHESQTLEPSTEISCTKGSSERFIGENNMHANVVQKKVKTTSQSCKLAASVAPAAADDDDSAARASRTRKSFIGKVYFSLEILLLSGLTWMRLSAFSVSHVLS